MLLFHPVQASELFLWCSLLRWFFVWRIRTIEQALALNKV
jgi:hypothetical protein